MPHQENPQKRIYTHGTRRIDIIPCRMCVCVAGWALLYQNHNSNSSSQEAYHTSVIVLVVAAAVAVAAVQLYMLNRT